MILAAARRRSWFSRLLAYCDTDRGSHDAAAFATRAKALEDRARELAFNTRTVNLTILAVTLVLIGLIVSVYGHLLTRHVRHLTDVADRISVGELDARIEIHRRDELGQLAAAIERMQDSLRLSIERLRRRQS